MKVNIQPVNFEIAKQLEDFIEKKLNRFARHLHEDDLVDIRLSVVKPQTQNNKEANITIGSMFAKKTADSFEEAISSCIDALETQLEKRKNA